MGKYIFDKSNPLWYERQGDNYIPCLSAAAWCPGFPHRLGGEVTDLDEAERALIGALLEALLTEGLVTEETCREAKDLIWSGMALPALIRRGGGRAADGCAADAR